MDRLQINVRLTPEQIEELDRKRIELQPTLGKIPTRSDVIRYALEIFLAKPQGSGAGKKGQ
ncbi:ribbon-helix-helix domain-containing protein [Viridibacterium curvum]|uniref:Ribbon-helix-helix protein, CopG family n=1 Tax=Viridibacterium curvum TaxID=1101404 RepID=A0ABP9R7G4_9RHOO